MCLTTKGFPTKKEALKYKKEGEILKKDLIVYKILNKTRTGYFSPFQDTQYERGYHYYQTEKPFTFSGVRRKWFSYVYGFTIDRGLHSYVNKIIAEDSHAYRRCMNGRVVKMVIPKGSKIYRGINGDIVSDNLIWY